jgi:hypothetical protein
MANDLNKLMSDGLAAPLGHVIEAVGRGVADAQAALDAGALAQTLAIYAAGDDALSNLLREIGYRPTFYALPETQCDMQVSIRIGGVGAPDGSAGGKSSTRAALYVTPVDAGFANRYAYSVEGSARLSFKIVPVPPPAALEDVRPVPDLIGRRADEALATLEAIELTARLLDLAGVEIQRDNLAGRTVVSQAPAGGTVTQIGSTVLLTMGPVTA